MIARAIAARMPFCLGRRCLSTVRRRCGARSAPGGKGLCPRREFGPLVRVMEPDATTRRFCWKTSPRRCNHPTGSDPLAGAGTKGPRLHDWRYPELADLEAEEFNDENHGLWTRGLLIRRNIADSDLAYFTTWCPAGTSIATLVSVEGHRWAIEDSFETAKNEFGLDRQRDQVLAWLASSCLVRHACLRHDGGYSASGKQTSTKKNPAARCRSASGLIRWSKQEIRRIAQGVSRSDVSDPLTSTAWSLWRRAHQAAAQKAHLKRNPQL